MLLVITQRIPTA